MSDAHVAEQRATTSGTAPIGAVADRIKDGQLIQQHAPAVRELAGLPMLIPVPRAARLLGISRSAAYRCAACGDLPTTHLGGRVYVITAKLEELLSA